ncbi:MAG: hypothetical protein RMJ98_10900 [Myxococcales bacterium]|nr:hypothetical protein [Polyangiaceae bacterium]MDW8249794.1 hypothetical protein [Myxococcales bacterium]
MRFSRSSALLMLVAFTGCERKEAPPSPPATSAVSSSEDTVQERARTEERVCQERIQQLRGLPALPGAPGFEGKRSELLGRGKGEPVVFLRAPRFEENLPLRLSLIREEMKRHNPWLGIPKVMEQLRYFPQDLRRLFLAEGYVYSESPAEAAVLLDVLKFGRLFRESELWVARGGETFRVVRDKQGVYRYAEGPQEGEEAALLFGDRVATSVAGLGPRLHRDLTALVEAHHPDQIRLGWLTERGAVGELRYGEHWIPAVLEDDGMRYTLGCLAIPPVHRAVVEAQKEANAQRAGSLKRLREAIHAMVEERLRFDEPLEEVGQQDGSLRPAWKWAYDHDATTYSFNGVGYQVFDSKGRPHPPQVCIDFVLDAYERASGSWFQRAEQPRKRVLGAIDFDAMDVKNRRSAAEVVAFASAHPEMFEVWTLPDEERIPFARRSDFFAYIDQHRERFQVGNVVIIHGFKDDGLVHYHSFLIESVDPLTGFPYRLAGNAGRPRLQSWEGVMRSAPRRSIRHVLIPRTAWLKAVLPPRNASVAER